jgi:hypothetical protein
MSDPKVPEAGDIPPAYEALHESGHAVMARLLGQTLGPIRIDPSRGKGTASVIEQSTSSEETLKILAAARICLNTFGIDTRFDQGGIKDEGESRTIWGEMFPDDDDEQAYLAYIAKIDCEVAGLFEQPNVRAAAWALAKILTSACEIDGPQAESVIDRHLNAGASVVQ